MHFTFPIFNIRNLGKLKEMKRTNKCLNIEEINSKAWKHKYINAIELGTESQNSFSEIMKRIKMSNYSPRIIKYRRKKVDHNYIYFVPIIIPTPLWYNYCILFINMFAH